MPASDSDSARHGDRILLEDRRGDARHATPYNGALRSRIVEQNVEIVDISSRGACIRIRRGFMPTEGEPVILRFMDQSSARGVIGWVGQTDCGVVFAEPLEDASNMADFSDMGAEFFGRIAKLQLERTS